MKDPTPHSAEDRDRLRELYGKPVMTVEDAAFVLGISRASAYQAVKTGEIKTKSYGKRKLVLTRPLFAELGYDGT